MTEGQRQQEKAAFWVLVMCVQQVHGYLNEGVG